MSAIFDFSSILMVFQLLICTCTYLKEMKPNIFDGSKPRDPSIPNHHQRDGFLGFCWKLTRIGERMSPYVSASCICMAFYILLFK